MSPISSAVIIAVMAFSSAVAAKEPDWGKLEIYLTETPSGADIPGKVALLDAETGERVRLLGQSATWCAVRPEAAYLLKGWIELPVLPGRYRVVAGRGLEYSVTEAVVSIKPGESVSLPLSLRREVDTPGYVAADLHLHTGTFAGHGDSLLEERLISIAGEGIGFVVATEHNRVADYQLVSEAIRTNAYFDAISGNEVSTKGSKVNLGDFSAYPLAAGTEPVGLTHRNARELFRNMRRNGKPRVIQVNHPRLSEKKQDYFTLAGLDPDTGEYGGDFSDSFDAVEIMNGNDLHGWSGKGQVRKDWFNLLNRGLRFTAVGGSDSHNVWYSAAGLPRSYIACGENGGKGRNAGRITEGILLHDVTVSSGIFVTIEVGGQRMGGQAKANNGRVKVTVNLRAPSWIEAEKVDLVVNGLTVNSIEVTGRTAGKPLTFIHTTELALNRDSWIIAWAKGPDILHPLYPEKIEVHGVTNPVWVDADGDGRVTVR